MLYKISFLNLQYWYDKLSNVLYYCRLVYSVLVYYAEKKFSEGKYELHYAKIK
jgi:hypothetical protein